MTRSWCWNSSNTNWTRMLSWMLGTQRKLQLKTHQRALYMSVVCPVLLVSILKLPWQLNCHPDKDYETGCPAGCGAANLSLCFYLLHCI
jgi:hypothetical protein